MPGCYAIIVAGGRGQRFGGEVPKQYAPLGHGTVLEASLRAFLEHPSIDGVRCVISQDDDDLYEQSISGLNHEHLLPPVYGGKTRQQSVLGGLESLLEESPDKVLIHDAARPFVSGKIISDVIFKLEKSPGVIPTVGVVDTLKKAHKENIEKTISRENLFCAQTPQGFRFKEIITAHREIKNDPKKQKAMTDDASILEQSGLNVAMVEGSEINFKITTQGDHARAQSYLAGMVKRYETRVGFGYDVHRLGEGRGVRLCGVDIKFDKSLLGHSDADVGLHAICDAVLGAIGEGDIGEHFPPTDNKFKDMNSEVFLKHATQLCKKAGARITNIDVTIICEAPKISPHRGLMRERVGNIVGLIPARVSIKATTTEGLGPMGRGEGIAAQAVASVEFPANNVD